MVRTRLNLRLIWKQLFAGGIGALRSICLAKVSSCCHSQICSSLLRIGLIPLMQPHGFRRMQHRHGNTRLSPDQHVVQACQVILHRAGSPPPWCLMEERVGPFPPAHNRLDMTVPPGHAVQLTSHTFSAHLVRHAGSLRVGQRKSIAILQHGAHLVAAGQFLVRLQDVGQGRLPAGAVGIVTISAVIFPAVCEMTQGMHAQAISLVSTAGFLH